MQETLHATILTEALVAAIGSQGATKGLIAHTADRGSQYASDRYVSLLSENNITASMSSKGNCDDNAMMESFFRALKVELIYRKKFATLVEVRSAIFEYIEVWYNRRRMLSSLDYQTPTEYELKHLNAI